MAATNMHGAAAPRAITPTSDNAPAVASGEASRIESKGNNADCAAATAARKRMATAQARAALLGLVLSELHDGACTLTGEAGRCGRFASLAAAEAVLYGIEQVRSEIAALVARIGRGGAR